MSAHALWYLCAVLCVGVSASVHDGTTPSGVDKKIELFDGVRLNIPKESNSTGPVMSLEVDAGRSIAEGGYSYLYVILHLRAIHSATYIVRKCQLNKYNN